MKRNVATIFIDALLLMLLVYVLLPHEPAPRSSSSVDLYAEIIIGARWPDGTDADVDLWVRSPGGIPIGYSRTRGDKSSFVWDDLGQVDKPRWRYEAAMIRRAEDGDYIVNLHLFKQRTAVLPIPVEVAVWRTVPGEERELWAGEVELVHEGQELTVVRFEIRNKEILPGSTHDRPLAIRSGS